MHTSLPARKDNLWFIAPICEVPLAKDWLTCLPSRPRYNNTVNL